MEMTLREQHWYDIICQCRDSGLTVRQWCMENGIHVSTFYRHARILKERSCNIPVGKTCQNLLMKQEVVPLQIIEDLPLESPLSGTACSSLPGDNPHQKDEAPYGAAPTQPFSPAIQIRFPNGIHLDVSNDIKDSVLRSVLGSLRMA